MQEIWVQSLGQEGPLEEEMATHSSVFAWRIPWTEEPGGLQSMGSQESDSLSHIRLFVTPWSVACQTPLSMGFSRQVYWGGLRCPLPGDLPNPWIEPELCLLHWQKVSLPLVPPGKPYFILCNSLD